MVTNRSLLALAAAAVAVGAFAMPGSAEGLDPCVQAGRDCAADDGCCRSDRAAPSGPQAPAVPHIACCCRAVHCVEVRRCREPLPEPRRGADCALAQPCRDLARAFLLFRPPIA